MASPQHRVSVATDRPASRKGTPEKLPRDTTETTISEPKWIYVGLEANERWECGLSGREKLFDFDGQACNVNRYSSSFVSGWQQRLALQWAREPVSRGIIVVCLENIEYIDTKSIIYARWGVEQEGTSLRGYLGPKSDILCRVNDKQTPGCQ